MNLSIDGDQLVVLDPPRKDPELLAPWLDQLAALATAIDALPLDRWIQPPREPRLSFYQHPEWYWIGQDDSLLHSTPTNRGGHAHKTSDVIRGRDGDGPPFVAFTHHWETTRTESSTDSNGRTTTRTVTDYHKEAILGFELPAVMPRLEVAYSGGGISFESEAFNDDFCIRADDQKFAYDVIHPRTMEFLMAVRPAAFRITGNWAWFQVPAHDHQTIARSSVLHPRLPVPDPAFRLEEPRPPGLAVPAGLVGSLGDQGGRAEVGPVGFDVVEAGLAAVGTEDVSPAFGDGGELRPEAVLVLVVDEHQEGAVGVVERVGHDRLL